MLILGLCSLIVFVLLKVRYAYALAVLMGALNIIPIVGAIVSMFLVLVAAAIDSWEKVVGVAIFYAIYAQVETSYLTPRIMKSSVDLSALGVLVALLMGSKLAGVVGAMIAVPTAVLVSVLIQEYLMQPDAKENSIVPAANVARKDGSCAELACYHEGSSVDERFPAANQYRNQESAPMTAHAVDPAAAGELVMTERVVTQPKVLHSRIADYQELFKVRVTSMVVLTAWAGFYLGVHEIGHYQHPLGSG